MDRDVCGIACAVGVRARMYARGVVSGLLMILCKNARLFRTRRSTYQLYNFVRPLRRAGGVGPGRPAAERAAAPRISPLPLRLQR